MSKSEFEIERGIPVSPREKRARYPFAEMEVGDSFFSSKNIDRIRSAAHAYGKYQNMKFQTAIVDNGIRVWRIA